MCHLLEWPGASAALPTTCKGNIGTGRRSLASAVQVDCPRTLTRHLVSPAAPVRATEACNVKRLRQHESDAGRPIAGALCRFLRRLEYRHQRWCRCAGVRHAVPTGAAITSYPVLHRRSAAGAAVRRVAVTA